MDGYIPLSYDGCVHDTGGGVSAWPMDESVPLMCFIIARRVIPFQGYLGIAEQKVSCPNELAGGCGRRC